MLLQNDQNLFNTVMTAPIGICILDAATLTSEIVNSKFLEVAGKPYDAIYGRFYWDSFAEAREYYEAALAGVVQTGQPYYADEVELMLIRNGKPEMIFVTFVYSPVRSNDGNVTKVAVWVLENTMQVAARRKIEKANEQLEISQGEILNLNDELAATNEELAASNEEATATNETLAKKNEELSDTYHKLEQSRNDLLFTIKAAGLATFDLNPVTNRFSGNDLLKSWFGLSTNDEIELSVATVVIAEQDKERVINAIQHALDYRSEGKYDIEFTIANLNDPRPRIVHAKGQALFNETKQPIRLSGTLQDVTEQKRNEQRKNDFIGMISHELKTPLTSLNAYIQVLDNKANKRQDTFAAGALAQARKQIRKMTTMINGFLNVSRLESSQIQIDKQRFDMALLMKEAEEEAIVTATSHQMLFAPVEPTFVFADRDKIGQVINNFLSNAVKYSPNGSTINITCVTINGQAQVSVKDRGTGIKISDGNKLFERYYRVENQNTKHISGFGIGLYLCKEIILRHSGKIWAESRKDKGAAFYFNLPLAT